MVFSSQIFIFIFLPLTLIIYYTLGNILSNNILKNCISLFASLIFYSWGGDEIFTTSLQFYFYKLYFWINYRQA